MDALCVPGTDTLVITFLATLWESDLLSKVIEEYGASMNLAKLMKFYHDDDFEYSLLHQCIWKEWYDCAGDILEINPDLTTVRTVGVRPHETISMGGSNLFRIKWI